MNNAYCETCDVNLQIAVEDLLDSDCSCPTCDAVLVLVEAEPSPASVVPLAGDGVGPLVGEGASAPPLPSWDGGDTQKVRELARTQIPASMAGPPPVDVGNELGIPDPAVSELSTVEIEGSDELARAWTEGTVPEPPPADETRNWADLEIDPEARSGMLFPDDPDWEALIEDSLTELEEPDENARRVMIRLPAEAALQNDADVSRLEGVFDAYGITAPPEMLLSAQPATEAFQQQPATEAFEQQPATETFPKAATQTVPRPKPPTQRFSDEPTRKWDGTAGEPSPEQVAALAVSQGTSSPGRTRPRRFARAATAPPPLKVIESVQFDQLDRALVCARHPESPKAESYLQLYHRLPVPQNGGPRIVLVTSPTRRDGRTTVAANLCVVAARTSGVGVLVDTDLHGRGALAPFGLQSSSTGLLNLLRTRGDPRRFVLQFRLGNLDVVPLGTGGRDAAELLCSDDMGEYLNELRDLYPRGLIVLDGSPILESASPLALSRHVDGVILVVRHGESRRDDTRRAARLVDPDRLLGMVFNCV